MKESNKDRAIKVAIEYTDKAVTFKSKVGACIYSNDNLYPGFNVENKIHKGYHAEEMAIINSIQDRADPDELLGIVISYEFDDHKVYPACASCRQYLWEYTNPELLITVVDKKGNIEYESKLKYLYPMPYPERRWYLEYWRKEHGQ